jgi:hypothetical protein
VRINLRKNDTVEVIAGKDAGKQGKVLKVIPEKNRVIVQGVGFVKKHTRPNPQRNIKGGIAEREGSHPREQRDDRLRGVRQAHADRSQEAGRRSQGARLRAARLQGVLDK